MRIADGGGQIRVDAALTGASAPHSSATAAAHYAADWAAPTPSRASAPGPTPSPSPGPAPTPPQAHAGSQRRELQTARVDASLADDVYNDTPKPPAGWRTATPTELAALRLTPAMLSDNTGFRARVYEGPDGGQVVAFRGSATRDDWENDFRQAAGFSTSSYSAALAIATGVAQSGARVTFTGHSLGGGLASAAAAASGRPAETFNASGLSAPTLAEAAKVNGSVHAGGPGRVDAWYVRGEVLSTLQDGGDRVVGAGLGGLFGGPVGAGLGGQLNAPSAYGVRHALNEVPPPGAGVLASHNPVSMHGMGWVERGLDKATAASN